MYIYIHIFYTGTYIFTYFIQVHIYSSILYRYLYIHVASIAMGIEDFNIMVRDTIYVYIYIYI